MFKILSTVLFYILLISQSLAFAEDVQPPADFTQRIDAAFGSINGIIASFLFYGIPIGEAKMPFIVLVLILGAAFYTLYFGFINIRAFKHSLDVVRGKYDNPNEHGEVSHFQALSAALSATVGLGNIAGVAVAVSLGGPGAVFWMVIAATLGMTSKFYECTLGQKYRVVRPDGTVAGGPMYYLEKGFAEMSFPGLGKVLAAIFAIFCIGGSFGGGNMFQANQSYLQISKYVPIPNYIFGLIMVVLVGMVIIGGIKRIASVADKVVPFMCGMYVLIGFVILFDNYANIPNAIATIISSAFNPQAISGGAIGSLIIGFQRAAFSNEAGVGSASIAHSAAKTEEPVREGIVALLEPFIDTIIVCAMTGIVVTVTEAYKVPGLQGVEITSYAYGTVSSWFPVFLTFAVFMFAYSTMISWSYYGEKAWEYFFGSRSIVVYKVIFLIFVFIGSVSSLGNVIDFSDMMILAMAFPNILGGIFLCKKVKADLNEYMRKYKANEFKVYK